MKLATLNQGGRDGTLVVVSRDLRRCRAVPAIARTMLAALDDWAAVEPQPRQVYEALNSGALEGEAFDQSACHSPLPRTWQWADGSAYINHVELVRRARNAEVPESFYTDPLMYQGGSDGFIAPRAPIVAKEAWGIDMEAEVTVVTGDVPLGATPEEAAKAQDGDVDKLRQWIQSEEKVVAVGEVGLDYHWPEPARDVQQAVAVVQ